MLLEQMGDEAVSTSCRLMRCLNVVLLIQLLSFAFNMTTLNLSIFFFQISLFLVGHLGATRFNTRLLKFYVGVRASLWVLNFVLLVAFFLYPQDCLTHFLPLLQSIPSEVVASHIHAWSSLEFSLFFLFAQLLSFLYTFAIVYSVALAWRLVVVIQAAALTQLLVEEQEAHHASQDAMLTAPQMSLDVTHQAHPAPCSSALYPAMKLP